MSGAMDRLSEVVRRMVSPGGCAWHEVQTHETLTRFLVEESAELIDAIERDLGPEEVSGELGDVLYQVMFHAAIAARDQEGYDLDAVANALADKLIARHPHVFGDRGYMSVDELHDEWERLKEDAAGAKRGSRGVLEGIPVGMPTLAKAAKVVDRIARAARSCDSGRVAPFAQDDGGGGSYPAGVARDPATSGALHPARRTTEKSRHPERGMTEKSRHPARAERDAGSPTAVTEEEIGEALLATVRRANAEGIDPDRALRLALNDLAERAGSAGSASE